MLRLIGEHQTQVNIYNTFGSHHLGGIERNSFSNSKTIVFGCQTIESWNSFAKSCHFPLSHNSRWQPDMKIDMGI
jgi:hypothetical protein